MNDLLRRFLFEGNPVRGEIVRLDATWRAVLERHDYPPAVRAPLGELLAAAALIAAGLKFKGTLTLQAQGDGPLALLVAQCTADQTLRGTANWRGDPQPAPLSALLGNGRLALTVDPGEEEGPRYQGVVPLEGETIAEALAGYMARSEQVDSWLALACDEERAAGMLIQRLPGEAGDADLWNRVRHLAGTVKREELLALPEERLLTRLFHEDDVRLFEPRPVSFRCTCSRERVVDMLRMLGRDEIAPLAAERGEVEVACEFCGRRYRFDPVDTEQLFAAPTATGASPTRH